MTLFSQEKKVELPQAGLKPATFCMLDMHGLYMCMYYSVINIEGIAELNLAIHVHVSVSCFMMYLFMYS